jgi:uncharacterized membrane protein YeaQ/YmgE (transglycosylase-associated protein family)
VSVGYGVVLNLDFVGYVGFIVSVIVDKEGKAWRSTPSLELGPVVAIIGAIVILLAYHGFRGLFEEDWT